MSEPITAVRYYVQFAGSNGKRRFVGASDQFRTHYPMQRDAAELFSTYEDACEAADNIPPRYLIKHSTPLIKAAKVLIERPRIRVKAHTSLHVAIASQCAA